MSFFFRAASRPRSSQNELVRSIKDSLLALDTKTGAKEITTPTIRCRGGVATPIDTPSRSSHIEKQKQKKKDMTANGSDAAAQELLLRVCGLLDKNAKLDENAHAAYIDKFKSPLSPWSIVAIENLVKNVEIVKKKTKNATTIV